MIYTAIVTLDTVYTIYTAIVTLDRVYMIYTAIVTDFRYSIYDLYCNCAIIAT